MKARQLFAWGAALLIVLWFGVNLVAIAGMYRLWWTRERVLYVGKSPLTQRMTVFERAGLPVSLVTAVDSVDSAWPEDVDYEATGDANALSYVKYLLLPRLVAEKSSFKVAISGGSANAVPVVESVEKTDRNRQTRSVRGFVLSLWLVGGITALIRCIAGCSLTLPQSLAAGLLVIAGMTVSSFLVFGHFAPAGWACVFVGAAGTCVGLVRAVRRKGVCVSFLRLSFATAGSAKFRLLTVYCCVVVVLMSLWSFLMAVVVVPDDWDSWATWGAKAKWLALGSGPLSSVTRVGGHADYPLVWPSLWAFTGWCSGGWEEQWAKGWGAIVMFLCAVELGRALTVASGAIEDLSWLGAAVFTSVPMVPLVASWGYAEPILWLMMVCCLSCLVKWRAFGGLKNLLLAGLFAAGAAHTKNEGCLFAIVMTFWVLWRGRKCAVSSFLCFAGPLMALLGPWVLWTRVGLRLGSVSVDSFFDKHSILQALHKIPNALDHISRMWCDVSQWNVVLWFLLAVVLWCLIRGDSEIRAGVAIFTVLLVSYFIVMIFFPADIYWTIGTSWNRLTVQLIPLLVLFGLGPFLARCRGHDSESVVHA